jgi:tetratricopeptide (TPR) repeat protein
MPDQAQPDAVAPARWSAWRNALPHLATFAVFAVFSFLSGGYVLTRAAPVAVAWLVAASVWVWSVKIERRPSRLYLAALVALGVYTLWAGLSVLWSFGPDLSWVAFNYAALYLAMGAVLGLAPTGRLELRTAGYGFLAVTVAVAGYAFAGKVLPEVVTHAHEYARLDSPVGYWNVLALLMAMAMPVALSLAARRDAALGVRALAAAASVPLAFTFVFAFSRGGVVALAIILIAYFALTDRRLASSAALVAVVAPVALAMWQVRDLDTLFAATNDAGLRSLEGHTLLRWSFVALATAVALQVVAVLVERGVRWPRRARLAAGTVLLVALAVGAVGGTAAYVQRQGGADWLRARYDAFVADSDTRDTGNSAGRLLSLNTGRPPLWRQALDQYDAGPKWGTGAGTYRFTHFRFRGDQGVTKHAHNQWLNALSELGIPGLVSFAAAMALLLAASLRGLRRGRRDPERALLAAMQAAIVGFMLHMTWDWDWDMGAAGTALFLLAATTSAYITHRDAPARRPHAAATPARILACGLLLLVALSWLPPYLSARDQNRAIEQAAAGDASAALTSARRAARWDPLAVDPLITLALLEQRLGRNRDALETLGSAVELQPQNYAVHYQLGLLLQRVFDRSDEAAASFRRALELNPRDPSSAYELEALAAGG